MTNFIEDPVISIQEKIQASQRSLDLYYPLNAFQCGKERMLLTNQ